MVHVCIRIVLTMPLAPLILLLMASIIGIPIGLAIGMAAGAWATAPMRKHPVFNVKDAPNPNDEYEGLVEDLT
jgi:hypothetical protein